MVTTHLAWDDVIDVHDALINPTVSTHMTITLEHALPLCLVLTAVEFIYCQL
jgi:hypothetical protein